MKANRREGQTNTNQQISPFSIILSPVPPLEEGSFFFDEGEKVGWWTNQTDVVKWVL